ncbi:hypothetical protein HYH02_008882 [Chlamydomonas schloesseri]|uniref:Autophagy-related protein 16 domain-containing protein n=1 Tax=Chlamydomonas schloesseri TaxID=2026947 RepID=A0A836B205_9CHLO|nr:hypothetical protein HYH02_008882 [Chlamydomonas schloesseri]|eukprot:KAG2445013.1 hypothetical protein HYH02_008882 [Chlamydomonas schloesseri]
MQATALAVAPDWVVGSVVRQLAALSAAQTQPFAQPFADYGAGLQRCRELEVRLLQLDKEAAELRDENAALHRRLAAADEAAAASLAAALEEARAGLARSEAQLAALYQKNNSLLEEVVRANADLATTRSALSSTSTELAQARAEIAALREQAASLAASLEAERSARVAAAAEAAAALATRDAALGDSKRLRAENGVLVRRLVELKESEAGRMNELNRMHEELLENAVRMKREAEMDRQATDLIRQKAVAAALAGAAAASAMGAPTAGGPGGGGGPHPHGGGAPGSTASVMISAAAPPQPTQTHQQPAAPAPSVPLPGTGGGGGGGGSGPSSSSTDPLAVGGDASGEWVTAVVPPAAAVSTPATAGPAAPLATAAASVATAAASSVLGAIPTSLREVMGLGARPGSGGAAAGGGGGGAGGAIGFVPHVHTPYDNDPSLTPPEHRFPSRLPVRVVPNGHKGGCASLAPQVPGHFVASCGADRAVALWDISLLVGPGSIPGGGAGASTCPAVLLHGMTGGVNDCGFTCDAAQVLAAGADRSLHLWDATSGRPRHTLTGHGGPVTGVAPSPMDARLAVSISEDRSFKLWDLSRGFAVRSVPMTKMPLALAASRDGNTLVTGHLDGSVFLWDVRQCKAGAAAPLMETRDSQQPVVALAAAAGSVGAGPDSGLIIAGRDGGLRVWDFRGGASQRLARHPQFQLGTTGGTGKPRCRLGVSPDGRLLAAGAADGSVWVWDLQAAAAAGGGRGSEPKQLRGGPGGLCAHREAAVAAAFSSDMCALVTGDKAGGLAFWAME